MFILNPGSVFFHSLYSESLYTLLSFTGIYMYYFQDTLWKKAVYSALIMGVSIFVRSTGLFYIVLSGYPILYNAILDVYKLSKEASIKII